MELLLQPKRETHQEQLEARRRIGNVSLEKALELEQRLVVEHDQVELAARDLRLCEAILDRVLGETIVVLLSGKPFFLGRRDDVAVTNQGGSTIVIVSRDSENVHAMSWAGT